MSNATPSADTFRKVARYEPVCCPVCGSNDCLKLFDVLERVLVLCNGCGHEYVNPAPVFVSSNNYIFPSLEADALATAIDITYITKILRKNHLLNCTLLDLGCGQGRLVHDLLGAGWEPGNLYLMDYDGPSLAVARQSYPSVYNIIERDILKGIGFSNYFDCILMEEFFEHLIYPATSLEMALEALKPGGILIIRGIPNNQSLESYLAREKWKMRLSVTHYSFFNPDTFATLAKRFTNMEVLEYGAFLQEGYHFYHLVRLAKDIGIINATLGNGQFEKYDGTIVSAESLTAIVLEKLRNGFINDYLFFDRLPKQELSTLSNSENIQAFFDRIHLDYHVSPDFSVVARKNGRAEG